MRMYLTQDNVWRHSKQSGEDTNYRALQTYKETPCHIRDNLYAILLLNYQVIERAAFVKSLRLPLLRINLITLEYLPNNKNKIEII